jgi:ribose 5-phosphate isomerase RpiB
MPARERVLTTLARRGGACGRGILICSTGIGLSIAANKVRGR